MADVTPGTTGTTEGTAQELRFKKLFTWGGVLIAILGLVFLGAGETGLGLLLVAAGVVFLLFAKRRTRKAGGA